VINERIRAAAAAPPRLRPRVRDEVACSRRRAETPLPCNYHRINHQPISVKRSMNDNIKNSRKRI
jgi:hypothetical protein